MPKAKTPKFKQGDRVVCTNPDRFSYKCHGAVTGLWNIETKTPLYLVRLDKSPSAFVKETYLYENDLKGEEENDTEGNS
jgi:hypothetical protein